MWRCNVMEPLGPVFMPTDGESTVVSRPKMYQVEVREDLVSALGAPYVWPHDRGFVIEWTDECGTHTKTFVVTEEARAHFRKYTRIAGVKTAWGQIEVLVAALMPTQVFVAVGDDGPPMRVNWSRF